MDGHARDRDGHRGITTGSYSAMWADFALEPSPKRDGVLRHVIAEYDLAACGEVVDGYRQRQRFHLFHARLMHVKSLSVVGARGFAYSDLDCGSRAEAILLALRLQCGLVHLHVLLVGLDRIAPLGRGRDRNVAIALGIVFIFQIGRELVVGMHERHGSVGRGRGTAGDFASGQRIHETLHWRVKN